MPFEARIFAASIDSLTIRPVAIIATSFPSRSFMPFPISNLYVSGSLKTGTANLPKRMYTGPLNSTAALTAALASTSSAGLIIVIPGIVLIRAISSLHW